jgi:LuxR family maltose regulon positive regulatory protein
VAPQPYLPRPRLYALLDAGVEQTVTLLRAGPGWGKTTLVTAWVAQRPEPERIAWLTVRHRHTGVSAFTGGVVAALRAAGATVSEPGDADGESESEYALLRRLESVFDRAHEPTVLVLDDLYVLDGTAAMRALALLVAERPAGLRLILLSRSVPDLPMNPPTIGVDDLALDSDEATNLVTLYGGADASPGEGWPLGVRLAAETTGPDAIDDYLWREVVAVQPAAIRRFLLRASVVEEVSPALAETLTGVVDSLPILEELERGLGFVTSREHDGRRWFRCHGRLRAMLRRRLEMEEPDEVAGLHAAAARWYAGEIAVPEALWHAAEAADWVYLGRIVAELAVTRIVSTDRRFLVDVLRRIPPELLPTTAELCLCSALLMLFNGDYSAIPDCIRQARAMLSGEVRERRAARVALDALEAATVFRIRGDMSDLVVATGGILTRLRAASVRDIPMLLQLRAIALSNKGVGLLWLGRLDQAEQYLRSGLRATRATGLELVEINAEGHLALLAYFRGSIGAAAEHADSACRLADRLGLADTAMATAAALASALVEVERDRVAEAQAMLRRALHTEANPPEATLTVVSSAVLFLLLAADDPAHAGPFLRQLRQETGPSLDAPYLRRWLDLIESEIDLALGVPEKVISRYRSRSALGPAEQAVIGRALTGVGDSTGERLLTSAAAGPNRIAAVHAWITLARLAADRGQKSRSAEAVRRATALAEPDGIRRPLRRLYPGGLDAASEHRPQTAAAELADPLSQRETEVLRFLPSVLTAQEIAGNLGVSVNTVKAHMRAIYRKLGAARRREAVDTAHRLGLL